MGACEGREQVIDASRVDPADERRDPFSLLGGLINGITWNCSTPPRPGTGRSWAAYPIRPAKARQAPGPPPAQGVFASMSFQPSLHRQRRSRCQPSPVVGHLHHPDRDRADPRRHPASGNGRISPTPRQVGLYLHPDAIAALEIRALNPADQIELDRVVTIPVGLAELPDPADITADAWRGLAAGAFPLEAHVVPRR